MQQDQKPESQGKNTPSLWAAFNETVHSHISSNSFFQFQIFKSERLDSMSREILQQSSSVHKSTRTPPLLLTASPSQGPFSAAYNISKQVNIGGVCFCGQGTDRLSAWWSLEVICMKRSASIHISMTYPISTLAWKEPQDNSVSTLAQF